MESFLNFQSKKRKKMTKCKEHSCKTCKEIKIETVEKFKEKEFNLQKIADYLGWTVAIDEVFNESKMISQDDFPRIEVAIIGKSHPGAILVGQLKSAGKPCCMMVFEHPGSMKFVKFRRITEKEKKEIKSVEIFNKKRGISCILRLDNESKEGFIIYSS